MIPKLFAFDLDGTLLDSKKRISPANIQAIREIRESGAAVALSSGRIGHSVRKFAPVLGIDPALVILNGAEVFTSCDPAAKRVRYAPLAASYAEYLTNYGKKLPIAVNYYCHDKLYTVMSFTNAGWIELYNRQTGVNYIFLEDFSMMEGVSPSKIIFVGKPSFIDEQEKIFRSAWDENTIYVCRSWDHYLEFMNPQATKGLGLQALCKDLNIEMSDVAAYGDAENDIPMIRAAGFGTAMKNADDRVKSAGKRVTELTNDEDWVAKEWEMIKTEAL